MVFSPLFINSEVQEGLTFTKQPKLKNTNYLFSDIINVFINQEQDNNSFPTLLKTQQSELPTLDVNSFLKENNINLTELVQQNLEEIKIEINAPESPKTSGSSENKNISLMNIISALISCSSESSNKNEEKNGPQNIEAGIEKIEQFNFGSIKEKLENGEKILLSLNTESGEKSFLISANPNIQANSDSKEIKNDLVINVSEINEGTEKLDAFVNIISTEGNDFTLLDNNENVIAQMTILASPNTGGLNIKNQIEENPAYAFQNSDHDTANQKPTMNFNSKNYFFNDSINYEIKSENTTDIKIAVNDKPTASNDLKLSLVKKDNNMNPSASALNELKNLEPEKIIASAKAETSAKVTVETNPQTIINSEASVISESTKKTNINTPIEVDQKIVPTNSKVSPELPNLIKDITNKPETAKEQSQTLKTSITQTANEVRETANSKNEFVKNLNELDGNAKVIFTKESSENNTKTIKQVNVEKNSLEVVTANVKSSTNNKELLSKTEPNAPKVEVNNTVKNVAYTVLESKKTDFIKSEIVTDSVDKNLINVNKSTEANKVSSEAVKSVNVNKQVIANGSKNISTEVPVNKSASETKVVAAEKTFSSEISSAKNEIVNGKAPVIIEQNGKPEQQNITETKNLTASEKLVSKETNINKTTESNIAQVKEKQDVVIKSADGSSKNIEVNINTKEKVNQEPISVKVKRNIKEINYIKSDPEKVKFSEKEILKNVENTPVKENQVQKNITSKDLKPEITNTVSVEKEIKLAKSDVTESKESINKNNMVQKGNVITKENLNAKNDLKESNSPQVKANVNVHEQKENLTNLSKPLPTEKPIVQTEKVLQGQKTSEPEKLVSQEKVAQTEKPVQVEKPIIQAEKVLQGQKIVEPEKLVSQEKVAQTEKPVQADKQTIQNEKAAPILKTEVSYKEKPSETYDLNKAKEVGAEVKNTVAKESTFIEQKEIQSKNNINEKVKEIIASTTNAEPKYEKEASVIKEVSLKNEVSKNEKIIPNENEVAANIKTTDGNSAKNENDTNDDLNKNELYKTSDQKDVKTELREKPESRFEKELINSKEEVAKKVGSEIKSEAARFNNNAERIVKTSEIMKELAKHVQKQDKNTLVLQIDPENLGKMKIKLEMIENSVRAKIEVESQIVRHHIESNINDLYSQLSKNGIQLGGLSISLSESETKTNKQFSGKKKSSGENVKDEEIEISEDMKTKSLGYNTYDYVV